MEQERRSFLIALIGATVTATDTIAQNSLKKRRSLAKFRLNDSLPSVYLSVVKIGKTESLDSKEEETYIWFKVHNNTGWPIWMHTSGVPKEYGDVYLYYVIEDYEKGERVIDNRPHSSSYRLLQPGRNWIFVAPLSYFKDKCQIRIDFSFDWENKDDVFAGREAEHSVCFLASQLPKSSASK
jgi:hypothetical protein